MKYNKFLEHYRFFTSNNETPEIFHLWVGMSVLAGACEKRLWLDRGYFKVYPNLYVVLIAPAGLAAKSTSMDLGQSLLEEAGITIMYGASSKEKIIVDMSEGIKSHQISETQAFLHSSVSYFTDELNVLLATGSDMVKFLVDIWGKDTSYSYRTKNSGIFEITNPYFNLIGAVVPQWFGANLANDLTATGFLARCILISIDDKRMKVAEPYVSPAQWKAREECAKIVSHIASMYGNITLTEEARAYYKEWYESQDIPKSEDYRIAAYLERRNKVHILKVATLMAVGDLRTRIEVQDFIRALDLFELTDKNMRTAYLMAGGNKLALHTMRIQSLVESIPGGIALSELSKIMMPDVQFTDFQQILNALLQMRSIELKRNAKGIPIVQKREVGNMELRTDESDILHNDEKVVAEYT